jgi:hypothetical protein
MSRASHLLEVLHPRILLSGEKVLLATGFLFDLELPVRRRNNIGCQMRQLRNAAIVMLISLHLFDGIIVEIVEMYSAIGALEEGLH